MGDDGTDKEVEEWPDNKTGDENCNKVDQRLKGRVFDFLAHGFIVAWIDGCDSYVVKLAKVAALAQWQSTSMVRKGSRVQVSKAAPFFMPNNLVFTCVHLIPY